MSNEAQAAIGAGHIATMLDVSKRFPFEETLGTRTVSPTSAAGVFSIRNRQILKPSRLGSCQYLAT
jgi:hypothetical protein